MTLVQELRRRRFLGRSVSRGKPPPKPQHIYFFTLPLFVKILALIVFAWVAYYVVMFIGFLTEEALAIALACAVLATFRPIREAFAGLLRGEPFAGRTLVETSPVPATFAYGALPTGAACFLAPYPEIACAAVAGGLAFRPAVLALDGKRLPPNPFASVAVTEEPIDVSEPGEFGLWIGESTGILSSLSSKTGIAPGSDVNLDLEAASRGIVIVGNSGAGKSRKVALTLMVQLFDLGAGGLIYDVKGDLGDTIAQVARITGRTVHRIGIDGLPINLLGGLSSDTAAAFLESCFRAQGQSLGDGAIWTNLAVERCAKALTILEHSPGESTLRGLYRFMFDPDFRATALTRADFALLTDDADLDEIGTQRLKAALDYQTNVVAKTEPKQQASINLSLETVLGKFADPVLATAFCGTSAVDLDRVLDGDLFIVHVPADEYAGSARTIYRLITQRFQIVARTRAKMKPGFRRDNPIALIIDEAQDVLAPGDEKFHAVCRSLNCVSIIASQSVEAYEGALGSEAAAMELLANFSSIIAFRSTEKTMKWVAGQCGEIDFFKLSESGGKNEQPPLLGFIPTGVTVNQGRSVSEERRTLIGPALFRSLEPEQCVALLTIGARSMDDVLRVPYISDELLARYS